MKRLNTTARACSSLGFLLAFGACATRTTPGATPPAAEAGNHTASEAAGARSTGAMHSQVSGLMPTGLSTLGATVLGDAVYVLGGYSGTPHAYSQRDQSRDFFRYDPKSQSWDKLASVGPIQSVGLTSDARYVYRVGGMIARNEFGQPEDMHSLSDVARFDPETAAWQAMTSLPDGRSSHQAVISGSTLYVVGGWKLAGGTFDSEWQQTLLRCDLSQPSCSWQSEPMPFATRAMGAAVYANKLYVLGGLTPDGSSDAVHVYDLAARTWSEGPSLPKGNLTICAAAFQESLYANGGDGVVYRLSPDGLAWQPAAALTFPRMFHQLVAARDGLLALGGVPGKSRGARVRHVEKVGVGSSPAGIVWTLPAESAAKNRQGALLNEQHLYVFGGNNSLEQHDFEQNNFVSTARRLDLGSLEWKPAPDFPVPRQSMQTLVTGSEDKRVGLVVGGFGFQGERLSSQREVFSYDFAGDKWAPFSASLPEARSQFGLVDWENAAWIFGGLNYDATRQGSEFQHPTRVLRLDLEHPEAGFTDAGFELSQMRRAFAGARLGDRYYLTGGLKQNFESVTQCESLDLKTKATAAMACPSSHRLGGELVALGDKLLLVGGSVQNAQGEREPTTRIESYDPASDKWSTLSETLPFDEPKQLQAFAYQDQLLLYTANRSTPTVQVALLNPAALAAGRTDFVNIPVP
jgi:N-acetylneuraminic acid mutarotase